MTSPAIPLRRSLPAVRDYGRELWQRREFAAYMAWGNLKARNASTALGLVWWILNPLLLGAIYGLIFGLVLKVSRGTEAYVSYLISGIFVFYYTRAAMVGGVNSIVSNTRLLANLRFPRLVLPISALIEAGVGFLASLSIFFLISGPVNGVWPGATIVWLVPALGIHTMFNLGLSAMVARIAVPFRDVNNLVPYVVRLWLYLSPIIYPVSFLADTSPSLRTVLEANPFFPLLAVYRHALLGSPMSGGDVISSLAWAVTTMLVGVAVFVRHEGTMTKYL